MRRFARKKQVNDAGQEVPKRLPRGTSSDNTRQDTPVLSAYFAKLGEQAAMQDVQGHAGAAATAGQMRAGVRREDQNQGEGARLQELKEQRVRDSHPIGDRRTMPQVEAPEKGAPFYAGLTLGAWGYYFVAKFVLYGMGLIAFHTLENLIFAAFILLSGRFLRRGKNILLIPSAIALLYHDSWLPPAGRLISQASLLSDFSLAYLFELLGRFVSWPAIAAMLACGLMYWIISRWLRAGVLVIFGMLALGVAQMLSAMNTVEKAMPDMNQVTQAFFAREAQRSVSFTTPQADAVPFDVIFIHVCSLSWDDVLAVGLAQHPLWKRFDFLLTRFNSAASYSGPAAIHLLRGKCGQTKHGDMYIPAEDKCYLMDNLEQSGFETDLALNHDGKFDNFLGQLKTDGHLNMPPLPLDGFDPAQYAFDNSPVYDDSNVLDRWLDMRQKSASRRVALYYNTISLHDGNHPRGVDSVPNTPELYKARLSRFLDETDGFLQKLEKSGRRAVVVMVPEHGAALRGDKRQIAGLREIPTPAITIVPVGIKVVGERREGEALSIDQSTSYLAISYIIERMLEQSPFDGSSFKPASYVTDLPTTPFVAQNDKTTVAEYEDHYYYTDSEGKWTRYREFDKPAALKW